MNVSRRTVTETHILVSTDGYEDRFNFLLQMTFGPHRNVTHCVRFEAFTAVTMKNGVFWDVTPCGSCNNRRFGGI
jgi:hypothetical protein